MPSDVIGLPRHLGQAVRKRRLQLGLSQASLAETAQVSRRLITSLEMGDADGIAFDKALLATKVGGTASLGFYMGMFVIVFAFLLTGIYVARANTRYDRLSAELVRSLAK